MNLIKPVWYETGHFIPLSLLDKILSTRNSILLHSGLNPAWFFFGCQKDFLVVWRWIQLRTFWGIFENNFTDFLRGCKPWKNIWNCSKKYPKMFKTDSILGNKKTSLNQNVWCDHATINIIFFTFLGDISMLNQAEIWKNILLSSSRAFSLSTPVDNNNTGYVSRVVK